MQEIQKQSNLIIYPNITTFATYHLNKISLHQKKQPDLSKEEDMFTGRKFDKTDSYDFWFPAFDQHCVHFFLNNFAPKGLRIRLTTSFIQVIVDIFGGSVQCENRFRYLG